MLIILTEFDIFYVNLLNFLFDFLIIDDVYLHINQNLIFYVNNYQEVFYIIFILFVIVKIVVILL